MKLSFPRLLRASFIVGVAVAALATPSGQVKADAYVVPPGAAGSMNLRTVVADPIFAGDSTTIAYMPSQYLILSRTPYLNLSIKGGYLGCDDWPVEGDPACKPGGEFPKRGDRIESNALNSGHRFVWEFYQMQQLTRKAGIPLSRIDSRNKSFWGTNPTGDADGSWKNLGFNGVTGATFQSSDYPQWNGYYVFLVKQVADEDQGRGYVDTVNGIVGPAEAGGLGAIYSFTQGCVYNGGGVNARDNNITCPVDWRSDTSLGVKAPTSAGVAQNAHYIKVSDAYNITSAPSKLAINTRYNYDDNNTDVLGYGFKVNTDGISCSRPGSTAANKYSIFNVDMDRTSEGVGSTAPPALRVNFPGRGIFYNVDLGGAYDYDPAGRYPWHLPGVPDYPFSAGWSASGAYMYLPYVNVNADTGSVQMNFHSLNSGNNMYLGGQFLTTGPLPGCVAPPNLLVTPLTPKAQNAGYLYNGQDSETIVAGNVDTKLDFSFQYQITGPAAANVAQADWRIVIDGVNRLTGRDTWPGAGVHVHSLPEFQVGSLAPGVHTWSACTTAAGPERCVTTTFKINLPPTAQTISPAPGAQLNYNLCEPLVGQVTDPDQSTRVGARFNVSWSDSRGSHVVQTRNNSIEKPSSPGVPARFTSDEVFVESWLLEGEAEELDFDGDGVADEITLTKFLKDQLSSGEAVTLNWSLRGYDITGASDLDDDLRTYTALQGLGLYNQDTLQAPVDGFRWGLQANSSFVRKSQPTFSKDQEGTKKFYKPSDTGNTTQLTNLTDGESVKVVTTIRNHGGTPTGQYFIKDYLGPVRDWERPDVDNVSLTFPDGSGRDISKNDVENTVLRAVKVDDVNQPDDAENGDKEAVGTDATADLTWRFDLGGNKNGGILQKYGAPAELKTNEAITLTYFIRSNRNSSVNFSDLNKTPVYGDPTTNYSNTTQVGQELGGELDATPLPGQVREDRTTPDISRAHTWVSFQVDYCDATLFDNEVIDNIPGNILAPYIRGGRGSIGTNESIQAYDSLGEKNATFTVTAGGNISHFTGENAFSQYKPGAQACRPGGGIDWRTEMTKNIEQKKGERHQTSTQPKFEGDPTTTGRSGFTRELDFNKVDGGILEFKNSVEISNHMQIKGTGTIIVNGDLKVNANMIYAADDAKNSLGVIVLGNLYITGTDTNPVTQMVGAYYVSDVNWNNTYTKAVRDASNCPTFDISDAKGLIYTGGSDKQLNVDGLMVARRFVLERYYVDKTRTKTTAAAENVAFDGRVLAETPPAFETFKRSEWYEVIPK